MARQNVPMIAFNRGLISRKALARVDLDRARMSAEVYNNFLPSTQGSMSIRPGTKYVGSSFNDTGAEWLEFIASTDDVALIEATHGKLRFWLGEDAHNLSLLERPWVDTQVSLSDTGWDNTSTGGAVVTGSASTDLIPTMTGATTDGVTITASSENTSAPTGGDAWNAADDDIGTNWEDTGADGSTLPSWLNIDFGSGNAKAVTSYSVRAPANSGQLDNTPSTWRLLSNDHDTGINATDTGQWTLEDSQTGQTGWAISEKRTFTTDHADTGTVTARRHWRIYVTAVDGDTECDICELELFDEATAQQVRMAGGSLYLNASAIGARAKRSKRTETKKWPSPSTT